MCVYKHGKGPLGKMHRALSISERVSKMMTGHVAFGKPAALCHLGLGPPCVPSPTPKNKLSLTARH